MGASSETDIVFADTYAEARASFLSLSSKAEADVNSYQHPTAVDVDKTPLFVDTAYFGEKNASKVLLSICGVHGQEFYAGSAAQRHWIRSEKWRDLPHDVAVLFVHALNPYGCANLSRSNENNVDLNRNFIDHTRPHPSNTDFGKLVPLLQIEQPGEEAFAKFEQDFKDVEKEIGVETFRRAVMEGQYDYPQATGYGGVTPEWSNTLLRDIISETLSHVRFVGYIDWHTGVGPSDDIFVVCFDAPGENAFNHLSNWWGKEKVEKTFSTFGHFKFRPDFSGVTFQGVKQTIPDAEVIGGIVEFGTHSPDEVTRALLVDVWFRFKCDAPDSQEAAQWRSYMMERLWPQSSKWRHNCLKLSEDLYEKTVAGLSGLS